MRNISENVADKIEKQFHFSVTFSKIVPFMK